MSYIQNEQLEKIHSQLGEVDAKYKLVIAQETASSTSGAMTMFETAEESAIRARVYYLPLMGGAVEMAFGRDGQLLREALGHNIKRGMPSVGGFAWVFNTYRLLSEKLAPMHVKAIWPPNIVTPGMPIMDKEGRTVRVQGLVAYRPVNHKWGQFSKWAPTDAE